MKRQSSGKGAAAKRSRANRGSVEPIPSHLVAGTCTFYSVANKAWMTAGVVVDAKSAPPPDLPRAICVREGVLAEWPGQPDYEELNVSATNDPPPDKWVSVGNHPVYFAVIKAPEKLYEEYTGDHGPVWLDGTYRVDGSTNHPGDLDSEALRLLFSEHKRIIFRINQARTAARVTLSREIAVAITTRAAISSERDSVANWMKRNSRLVGTVSSHAPKAPNVAQTLLKAFATRTDARFEIADGIIRCKPPHWRLAGVSDIAVVAAQLQGSGWNFQVEPKDCDPDETFGLNLASLALMDHESRSKFVQFCANVVDGRQFEKLWLAPKTANWAVQAHTVWSKRNSHFYGLHAAHLAAFEASALSDSLPAALKQMLVWFGDNTAAPRAFLTCNAFKELGYAFPAKLPSSFKTLSRKLGYSKMLKLLHAFFGWHDHPDPRAAAKHVIAAVIASYIDPLTEYTPEVTDDGLETAVLSKMSLWPAATQTREQLFVDIAKFEGTFECNVPTLQQVLKHAGKALPQGQRTSTAVRASVKAAIEYAISVEMIKPKNTIGVRALRQMRRMALGKLPPVMTFYDADEDDEGTRIKVASVMFVSAKNSEIQGMSYAVVKPSSDAFQIKSCDDVPMETTFEGADKAPQQTPVDMNDVDHVASFVLINAPEQHLYAMTVKRDADGSWKGKFQGDTVSFEFTPHHPGRFYKYF